jgi:hypothetical protein
MAYTPRPIIVRFSSHHVSTDAATSASTETGNTARKPSAV